MHSELQSMCMPHDHAFGLLETTKQNAIISQMQPIFNHHVYPLIIKNNLLRINSELLVSAMKDAISALGSVEDTDGLKCLCILQKALPVIAESNREASAAAKPSDA